MRRLQFFLFISFLLSVPILAEIPGENVSGTDPLILPNIVGVTQIALQKNYSAYFGL